MNSIQSRIARIFTEKLNLQVNQVDMELVETGILDSMGLIDLLVELEKEFGIRISIEEIETDDFRSIAKIEEFIMGKVVSTVVASV